MSKFFSNILLFLVALMITTPVRAGNVTIAVASNFTGPVKKIIADFEKKTGDHVRLTLGSSGKIFAQISHGAPFDIFLSADSLKPATLEKQRLTLPLSRFTYAIGALALWSPRPGLVTGKGGILDGDILARGKFRRLAMANPKLAPYGIAARQVLRSLKLYDILSPRLVMGENIAQTYQFIATGNADLGFVALSQIQQASGSYWVVPEDLYQPVRQDAVLLKSARDNPAALAFSRFLKSGNARKIIRDYGYKIAEEPE